MANIINLNVLVENDFLGIIVQSIGDPSFLSVLGSHLLINLKEAGELGLKEGTNYKVNSRTVSDIDFENEHVKGQRLYLTFAQEALYHQ